MNTIKSNKEFSQAENGCCTPVAKVVDKNDPCCDQPTDGSSCCDKSESKVVNVEKTGCC